VNHAQTAIAIDSLAKARHYAQGVLSGEITACRLIKLAVQRDETDRQTANQRGLYFDEYAAARVLVFMQQNLRLFEGKFRGQYLELEPWQCWKIAVVFGWKRADGTRRYRQVYEEVARKNAKTTLLAGVAGWGLLKDDEGAPEIYAAARTREQAKKLWETARIMFESSPAIKKRVKFKDSENKVLNPANHGKFVPLSSDSKTADGQNPDMSLLDEIHAHRNREMYDVQISGMASREQPLLWGITTAGFTTNKEGSICLELRQYLINILEGKFTDDEFFGVIYTLDDWETEWKNPESWVKANPNLEYQYASAIKWDDRNQCWQGKPLKRGSVSVEYLKGQVTKAQNSPAARIGVLVKNFNAWMASEINWLNPDKWAANARDFTLESLAEAAEIHLGIDLASVNDLASIAILAKMPDGTERVWQRSYVPQEQVDSAIKTRSVPYDQWIRDGWLVATPGAVTDYEYIIADLLGQDWRDGRITEGGILYHLPTPTRIGGDRWNLGWVGSKLIEFGLPVVGYGMGYQSMSPAMKELERAYLAGTLHHCGDPLLTWAMSNVVATLDPALNVKPDKKASKEKIDPAVALFIAKGVSLGQPESDESAYQDSVYI